MDGKSKFSLYVPFLFHNFSDDIVTGEHSPRGGKRLKEAQFDAKNAN